MYKRSDTLGIKLQVMIALSFFKKIEIEKRGREISYQMERELDEWSKNKGIKFSVRNIQKPFYVAGHATCKIKDEEHYKILSFSK